MPPKKETVATRNILASRVHETFDLARAVAEDKSKLPFFKIKYRLLEKTYEDFQALHVEIISQSSEADRIVQDQIRKEIDDIYIQIVAIFEEVCPTVLSTPGQEASRDSSPTSMVNVRLPKLELIKFAGDLKTWQTFIDIFNSSVHNASYISNINKFQYLIASLSEEPLTLVKSIPLTAANYQVAYDALVDRYSNKRLLMVHHWHTLKNYPVLTTDNFKLLRKLIDTFSENISVLEHLGCKVAEWDFILTDLLLEKLDQSTRKRFELSCDSTVMPEYKELKTYLLKQCVALETVGSCKNSSGNSTPYKTNKSSISQAYSSKSSITSKGPPSQRAFVVNTNPNSSNQSSSSNSETCPLCKLNHQIYRCPDFLNKSPSDRFQAAKQARLCVNCLRSYHRVANCESQITCKTCRCKHHSLLHFDRLKTSTTMQATVPQSGPSAPLPAPASTLSSTPQGEDNTGVNACTSMSSLNNSPRPTVLLATVSLQIKNKYDNYCTIRALLDPGSQASFIVDSSVKTLGLTRSKNDTPIFGLGHASVNSADGMVACHIRPRNAKEPTLVVDALIIKSICSNLPSSSFDVSQLEYLRNLPLADPNFNNPGPIHMLLGADIYPSLLKGQSIMQDTTPGPMAVETLFGWTLLGPVSSSTPPKIRSFFASTETCSDDILKRFWDIEEVPSSVPISPEDQVVETLFCNSHFRTSSGRFGVELPFRITSPTFENSRMIADRRLIALERRLRSQSSYRKLYIDFMQDYVDSGHMSIVNSSFVDEHNYYIPHHGVLTSNGDTQKIRVVFDASARADNNLSLNDTLYPGPKLQLDISQVLLRFRLHNVVFTCDIRQMYRQILVAEEQRKYQLIRWRFNPNDPIQTYRLNTVTYGVNSSPYLAIRTLQQLAEEGIQQFPLAAAALRQALYVDDLVCGASSVEAALLLRNQLISLLSSGCFELRKWSANNPMILEDIPISHRQQQTRDFDTETDTTVKVLGLQWHSISDSFSFKAVTRELPCTKRNILSEIARIYDPLGFISPLSLFVKQLLQHLWTLGLNWDDVPPDDVVNVWLQFKSELSNLSSLRIPRNLFASPIQSCQLHAFCDASELGYGCVIYFRLVDLNNQISVHFVAAKSKVAPLKRLSIPRLELCAAVLLAKLVDFVMQTYQSIVVFEDIIAWSDSTVALTWIRAPPHRWKNFVANRVTYIQERLAPSSWRYVSSLDNPADPASRGLLPSGLLACSLWWAGPSFLQQPSNIWSVDTSDLPSPLDIDLEEKSVVLLAQISSSFILDLLNRFSSLRKIQGIVAYILRFVNNCKRKTKMIGLLSEKELQKALFVIVKVVQAQSFSQEILALQRNKKCPKNLQKLSPFLDLDQILRVGGRLAHSDLSFSAKHPALLPRKHRFTELVIRQVHEKNLHPGINTTMYLLQQNFWILSTRRAIRHYLSSCYRCFRANPISYTPPMGNLPKVRISQVKPFSCVGVDYAGPFTITLAKGRGVKTRKAYLCLFICFATKAIHLELASDLSTEAFLAALRRFIARRGRCSQIYSDCGTNFVGAHRELNRCMETSAEAEHIAWSFNPPATPHFGGLWERGVRSVKTHLYRVIGSQILTYEELNTLFVQIESVLNSRPLCSLSSDPNDLSVLTPGHFLTLEPLTAAPESEISHLPASRLSRWQLIQQMHQNFWTRWKDEYLHNLYKKSKWSESQTSMPIEIGTLVLIKDNLAPPLKWRIGRIVELHPGADGIARVASVNTAQGTFKRPLVKLCALPSN